VSESTYFGSCTAVSYSQAETVTLKRIGDATSYLVQPT